MRLAIVNHTISREGGQARVNLEIVREALARGHHVTALTMRLAPDLQAHPRLTWARMPDSRLPTQLARNLDFAWRSAAWLRRHRGGLDRILVNGFVTWFPGEVNAVHFVHSAWRRSPVHTARISPGPYGWYHALNSALNARRERRAFRQARCVIAVSDNVRRELHAIGVPPAKTEVILNGVDPVEFTPGAACRRDLNLPSACRSPSSPARFAPPQEPRHGTAGAAARARPAPRRRR